MLVAGLSAILVSLHLFRIRLRQIYLLKARDSYFPWCMILTYCICLNSQFASSLAAFHISPRATFFDLWQLFTQACYD